MAPPSELGTRARSASLNWRRSGNAERRPKAEAGTAKPARHPLRPSRRKAGCRGCGRRLTRRRKRLVAVHRRRRQARTRHRHAGCAQALDLATPAAPSPARLGLTRSKARRQTPAPKAGSRPLPGADRPAQASEQGIGDRCDPRRIRRRDGAAAAAFKLVCHLAAAPPWSWTGALSCGHSCGHIRDTWPTSTFSSTPSASSVRTASEL